MPDPGEAWLEVTAALIDVLGVVVLRAPSAVGAKDAARIGARLRQHEMTLPQRQMRQGGAAGQIPEGRLPMPGIRGSPRRHQLEVEFSIEIGEGNRFQQRLRIGMERRTQYRGGCAFLDNLSQIHDADPVADMLHNR